MKSAEIFVEIIINTGIAQGFLVAIFVRGKNINSQFLLSLLLITLSLIIFRIHYLNYSLVSLFGHGFFVTGPFILLLGPFLYFYMRGIVLDQAFDIRNDLKHFVVFLLYGLLLSPIIYYGKDSQYAIFLWKVMGSPWIFFILQFGYYLYQTNRLLKTHQKNIVEKFSNVEGMDVSWLKWIVWVFAIILVFISIAAPSLIHGIGFSTYNVTSAIFFSLILFFIAYRGLQQRASVEISMEIESTTITSGDEIIEKIKKRLLHHVEENKPFLNPELTLTDLAKQLDVGRNQLSLVINTGVGDNFYNFINKFRVEEVKELIKKDSKKKYTIEVGI